MRVDPADCTTLQMVRDQIDRIDRGIVSAIAERGGYVARAARFKADQQAVRAPDRGAQVICKVVGLAEELGADPIVVEATWRAMIDAFIERELIEHAALRSASGFSAEQHLGAAEEKGTLR